MGTHTASRTSGAGRTWTEAGAARVALLGVLGVGLGVRLWLALPDDGISWPDEIYQSLEPAHRAVWGYGLVAWEFAQGARSWAFPGLLAGLLQLAAWVGVDTPREYLLLVRAVFCLVGVGTAWGAARLAQVSGASPLGTLAAAALFALPAPVLYFAPRALSETASALPVVTGLALALTPGAGRWRLRAGASLLGLAVLLRLQNGLFCLALLAVLTLRGWRAHRAGTARDEALRPVLETAGVLALWAVLYGALDRLTWGSWFHSFRLYWQFNVVEGKSSNWGVSPPQYYLRTLWRGAPLPLLCLAVLCGAGARRAAGVLAAAGAFLVLHSLIPHKELRFILPALPLFAAVAGVGVDTLRGGAWRRQATAAVLVACAVSAAGARSLTFGQLGAYGRARAHVSAWDDSGPVNRLLLAAHDEEALCGLKVEAVHLAWTGGHAYLHRPVPLYPHTGPSRASGLFNYVITTEESVGPAAEVRARDGGLVLARLATDRCAPDPGYGWALP